MVSISRSERVTGNVGIYKCSSTNSCCRFYYTYKNIRTGVTYTDRKLWTFMNPYGSCVTSFAPVMAVSNSSL
jgi:hypothetical protein